MLLNIPNFYYSCCSSFNLLYHIEQSEVEDEQAPNQCSLQIENMNLFLLPWAVLLVQCGFITLVDPLLSNLPKKPLPEAIL